MLKGTGEKIRVFLARDWPGRSFRVWCCLFGVVLGYDLLLHRFVPDPCPGDTRFYWFAGDAFLKHGAFSLLNYFHGWPNVGWGFVTFRGYLVPLLTLGIRTAANFFHLTFQLLYIPLAAAVISSAFTFLLPALYKVVSDRQAKTWQVLALFGLFTFFWRGFYFYLLLDLYGLLAFLGAAYYLFRLFKSPTENKYAEYFIWGVVGAVAVQLRSAYTLMIALSGVSMAVIFSRDLIRHARATGNFRTIFGLAAGHAWRLLLFAVGILLVEVPQVIIFREAGFHWKLFPFDSQNGLFLRSALGNILLVNLYPYTVVDQLGLKLVQVHFGLPGSLDGFAVLDAVRLKNFGDLMELWRQHPFFFLWHYPKRFFDGLDVRFSNPYPIHRGDLRYLEVFAVMFTNYTMLFVGAWSAFNSWRKKIFSRHEVMFLALIFVFVAVQVLLHVEWRYFIPGHFIFYYLLVFHAPHLGRRFTKTQAAAVLIAYLAFLLLCIILGTDVTLKLREMEPFRYVLGCW